MTKILIGMLSLALVGTGGLVAAVEGLGGSDPLPSISLPAAGTTTGTTTLGTTTATTTAGTTTGTTTAENDDVSGPCDEAEHANDPRCTGAGVPADDRRDDDRRGGDDNSGRGSGSDDDDHSGPGRGGHDDDRDDDRGDRDRGDNSGHGSDD